MKAYYNENDPKAAAWLRELINTGLIADGDVDGRSIVDVHASNLIGYGQVHLFAGIGGWSHAFRLAGISDDFPAWSCSCPCQPFSQAGKQKGFNDERHLWPEALRLIQQCNPILLFGEQVASEPGRAWLSGVRADLEKLGYAVGAADLCAPCIGAPHQRQRLYWFAVNPLADTRHARMRRSAESRDAEIGKIARCGHAGGMADPEHDGGWTDEPGWRPQERTTNGWASRMEHANCAGSQPGRQATEADGHGNPTEPAGDIYGMGNSDDSGSQGRGRPELRERGSERTAGGSSAWSNFDIIPCRDGKARRIESSALKMANGIPDGLVHLCDAGERQTQIIAEAQETFPLIKNASARAMRLRGYGNAIVPPLAAIFIRSALEAIEMARTEKVEAFEQSTLF